MICYGDQYVRRALKITDIPYTEFIDESTAVGFIEKHGLIGEFISKLKYDYEGEEVNIDTDPKNLDLTLVEYNGVRYWYGENSLDSLMNLKVGGRRIGFYRELPNIFDDHNFHWKKNKKYGTLECVMERNKLEFHCIYKPDGNAIVNVKYTACENLHKNKVTISTIEINYANNGVIMKGILRWLNEFQKNVGL